LDFPDSSDSLIGEKIGSYVVLSKIGEGGMGAVYLAMHPEIKRQVAIKILLPELSRLPDAVQRFSNEAKASARIRHPALVDTIDFGTRPDGSFYIIMEFLEGESLGARLKRVGLLPGLLAAMITRQIAEGVAVAHGAGVVHRDLKPDNIFLTPHPGGGEDMVKILDFGIAKQNDPSLISTSQTKTGAMIGTPLFMAPEQCRGAGQVDHRADLYSIGCIMYCMLCGRPPFIYSGAGELIAAHLYEPPAPPRSLEPTVPEALEAVVMRALAKKREDRYRDAAELVADLDAVISTIAAPGASQAGAPWWRAQTQAISNTPAPPMGASGLPAAALRGESPTPYRSPTPAAAHAAMLGRTQVLQPSPPPAQRQTGTSFHAHAQKTTLSSATGNRQVVPDLRASGKSKRWLIVSALGLVAAGAAVYAIVGTGPGKPGRVTAVQVEAPLPARPLPRPEPVPSVPEPVVAPKPEPLPAETPKPLPVPTHKPAASAEPRTRPEPGHVGGGSHAAKTMRVTVANPPEGIVVFVDGRVGKLPLKLPLDQSEHLLRFESPTTRPESKTVRADGDKVIELANKLRVIIE
jgi:serine/threonine protein kinase